MSAQDIKYSIDDNYFTKENITELLGVIGKMRETLIGAGELIYGGATGMFGADLSDGIFPLIEESLALSRPYAEIITTGASVFLAPAGKTVESAEYPNKAETEASTKFKDGGSK